VNELSFLKNGIVNLEKNEHLFIGERNMNAEKKVTSHNKRRLLCECSKKSCITFLRLLKERDGGKLTISGLISILCLRKNITVSSTMRRWSFVVGSGFS
jgi:hypothetical protein